MFVLPSRNLSAALVLLALCACASSPYNAVPPGNAAASGSAPWELRAPIPAFTKKSSYLYVANSFAGKSETGEVDLYAFPLRTKPSPVGAIKTGTYYPLGLAVDLSGNLYVANNGASSVTVYPPGGSSPSKTITDGISAPRGIALDTDGTLYVANYSLSDYLGTVSVYPPGKTSPSYIINYGGCPFGLAVYKHNLYISDACDSQIFAVKKGSKTPKSLQLSNISFPLGIGFDSLGNLYVANASSDLIDVYP
ncbi:MAG TPA: hypothetical protein VJP76_01280, partial [Candidatus Tumulicola sp.]|nr:hypothetical protein [Candidatus Tumulicola sp.]